MVSIKYIFAVFEQQGVDDLEINKEEDTIIIGYFGHCPVNALIIKNGFLEKIAFPKQEKLEWLYAIMDKKIKVVDDYFNKD